MNVIVFYPILMQIILIGCCKCIGSNAVCIVRKLKKGILIDTSHWLSPSIRMFKLGKSTKVDTFCHEAASVLAWCSYDFGTSYKELHQINCCISLLLRCMCAFQLAECHIFSMKIQLPLNIAANLVVLRDLNSSNPGQ